MTTPRFRLGLVVGKFSPLHLGHLWLIGQAASSCERVLVLSYSQPEFERCGATARRRWLASSCEGQNVVVIDADWLRAQCARRGMPYRALPPNEADDLTQQDFLAWVLADLLQQQPDAMFASEPYLLPCTQVLSARFGRPVTPVMGDPARQRQPITATLIRQAPQAMLDWLPPVVRADFVPRVVLLGGESTGKTSLAAALARHLDAPWVAEYGRELWDLQGGELSEADLLKIAREQQRRESDAAAQASPVLVCDTSPLTTYGYSLWRHGRADPQLAVLAGRPYDLSVLCGDDIPFVQDGTRQDEDFRRRQQAWYREQLAARGQRWIEARGSLAERVAQVVAALA
jgi:NadR type nicotinamide-nucleotide adenylyltransferase